MSLKEISELQDGELVRVTWSGGNGPHVYRVKRTEAGDIVATIDAWPNATPGTLYNAHLDRDAKVALHKVDRIG